MSIQTSPLPILGFAAYSGTGKTTLLEALIPQLTSTGLRIGLLKHAHHDFDIDKPGKDSYRLRKAGATQTLIASRLRHAFITETPDTEAQFTVLLNQFDHSQLDLILVEGCKNIAFPKIELHREVVGKPWLHPFDPNIIAVASDTSPDTDRPTLDINNIESIAQFVLTFVQHHPKSDGVTRIGQTIETADLQKTVTKQCVAAFDAPRQTLVAGIEQREQLTQLKPIQQCYRHRLAVDLFDETPQKNKIAKAGTLLSTDDIITINAYGYQNLVVARTPLISILAPEPNVISSSASHQLHGLCATLLYGKLSESLCTEFSCELFTSEILDSSEVPFNAAVMIKFVEASDFNFGEMIVINHQQPILVTLPADPEFITFAFYSLFVPVFCKAETDKSDLTMPIDNTLPMDSAIVTTSLGARQGCDDYYWAQAYRDQNGGKLVDVLMPCDIDLVNYEHHIRQNSGDNVTEGATFLQQGGSRCNALIWLPKTIDCVKSGEHVTILPLQGKI